MPQAAIRLYLNRLPALQAEFRMLLSEAVIVPHLDAEARRTLLRRWEREAAQFVADRERSTSVAAIRMMGIGVKRL